MLSALSAWPFTPKEKWPFTPFSKLRAFAYVERSRPQWHGAREWGLGQQGQGCRVQVNKDKGSSEQGQRCWRTKVLEDKGVGGQRCWVYRAQDRSGREDNGSWRRQRRRCQQVQTRPHQDLSCLGFRVTGFRLKDPCTALG